MDLIECVGFILTAGNQVLAEKRKRTDESYPGITAIPGGHVEAGESWEEALVREAREELGIVPGDVRYVCALLHRSQGLHRIHYYAVGSWEGEIENREAEYLLWIPMDRLERFDIEVDRVAVSEYLRVYGH